MQCTPWITWISCCNFLCAFNIFISFLLNSSVLIFPSIVASDKSSFCIIISVSPWRKKSSITIKPESSILAITALRWLKMYCCCTGGNWDRSPPAKTQTLLNHSYPQFTGILSHKRSQERAGSRPFTSSPVGLSGTRCCALGSVTELGYVRCKYAPGPRLPLLLEWRMMPGVAWADSPGAGSVVGSPGAVVVCSAAPDFPWWSAPGESLYAPAPDGLSSHPLLYHSSRESPPSSLRTITPSLWISG